MSGASQPTVGLRAGAGGKPPRATEATYAPGAVVPAATAAARGGATYVTEPTSYDAVLLLGFGGPEASEDVMPFLRNVTAGRGIPDERLAEVAEHYHHFGGVSPINAQNRALRQALEEELARTGPALPVLWGNRNFAPYLTDALHEAHEAGHRRLLVLATSAYSSYSSCRQYREDLADALAATGLADVLEVDKIRSFFDHPGFVESFVTAVEGAVAELAGRGRRRITVLFATHSIPTGDAERSGAPGRDLGPGGAYEAQHLAVGRVVMERTGVPDGVALDSALVYQSRSGPPSQPWLEPDINDHIADIARDAQETGADRPDALVIAPIGFLSDHLEVLWDLDNEAMETAAEHGFDAIRVPTPGADPTFVAGLADLVRERAEGRPRSQRAALTELGPDIDVCRPECCANARRPFAPAVAGVAP
ncbi:ferrochelatase [Pseudactinotalea suaedae]|uniref:ferrochelatase n=1 Tax=Pseudactinotalea suaedae TaxID=1524924 RepID=UPI0012E284CB|nr:ferrochelatase [Pseudactinotalea suaedae]